MNRKFCLPLLCDGVILLRALESTDLTSMLRWENDSGSWHLGSAHAPYSIKQIEEYIATYDGNIFAAGQLRLIIEDIGSGRTIGAVDLYEFDAVNRRSAVGILIDKEERRKGYALRALRLVSDYTFRRLGLKQLWAVCAEYNVESQLLFNKAGFQASTRLKDWLRDGTDWYDAIVLQKIFPDAT